jgi:chitodextrinase
MDTISSRNLTFAPSKAEVWVHMVGRTRAARALVGLMVTLLVGGVVTMIDTGTASAEPGGIVISELNYHAGSDLDEDDFLELTNTGTSPIDMSGWSFTAGVTGILPAGAVVAPGGFYVVAKDAATFQATNGFAPDALYGGNLSNGGETVTLVDASANVIDTVTYADAAPWPGAPDGNGPTLELRDVNSDNSLPENWGASLQNGGTPRAVNSLAGSSSTTVQDVTATPQRPAPGQAVVVSAKLPVGSTATLTYKVMFGANVVVPFLDDAASPGGAGDGVYAASIPGQSAGRLIRYRIDGTHGGTAFAMPTIDDTINFLGVVVTNPTVTSALPVIEWFMDDAVYNDILANHRFDDYQGSAVVAYNGTVYDNVLMNIRGQSSRSMAKVNWEFNMAPGHEMDMRPFIPYTLDEWALQRDPDPLADLGWETIGESGARRLGITAVRSQRNGQFWSVGRFMEKEDGTWRDVQGVDDWSIYKGDGGGLAKTSSPAALQASAWLDKKTRDDEDYSDAWALSQAVDAPASTAQKAWLDANVNVPELINYMAISSVLRHTDSGWKNWYIARDTEGTGRWELWFWDVNWIFATPAEDHAGTFLTPDVQNHLEMAMLQYPDYRQMFFRRLRTLADQFLTPGLYESKWDAIAQPYVADWALDTAAWPETRSSDFARQKFLQGLTDRRTTIAANTGPGKDVPVSQSPDAHVVINELQYHPAGANDSEYIELTNPTSEAVDLSGWTIDAVNLTIQGGTVLLPGAQVVFVQNDAAFRAEYGSNHFVGGQYSGKLSNDGEEVTLRDGSRVVDTVTYSNLAPWPTAADGTGPSLELGDPGLDNADPANWYATSTTAGSPGAPNPVTLPPDTTPPSAPVLSTSGVSATGANLTWTAATDDRLVSNYRITRNGTTLTTVPGRSYSDAALTGGATYTYSVRAIDSSGNVGPASNTVSVTTPPGYTPALFADTFTAADGSPWGSAWVPGVLNGSTTVQGNAGRLAFDNVTGAYSQVQLAGVAARANSEALLSYRWNSTAGGQYLDVYLRGSGGWQNPYRPRSGYGLELSSSSATVALRKNVNGVTTTLSSASANTVTTAKQWIRLRTVGTTIQYKIWVDGQAEPAAWRSTVTDSSVTAPGQLFIANVRGGSNTAPRYVAIDDVTLGTGDGTIVIPPTPDTTAPSAPSGLAASNITPSGLTLTWGASSDDVGVTGYQVVRNGTVIATPTGTTYTDSGLTAHTTYTYVVRAVDAAANVSGDSNTITPTTLDTPPPGTSLFSDLFAGADGSAWGSGWTTTTSAGSATIQGNGGRLALNDTTGAYARAQLTGLANRADSEALFSYQWNSTAARTYFSVYLRGSGGWSNPYRPTNGYGLELASDSATVTVRKVTGGTVSNLASVSGANSLTTAKQWIRLRVVGTTIQFKTWIDGQTEPAAWRSTTTDTAVTAPGQLFISNVRSGSNTGTKNITIDDLTITDGGN